jgi:2,3-bisphosphoglycerate-independent phosphoglycerate mutase
MPGKSEMKKLLYVALDDLCAAPIKELGNRTPLEAALTPHMDKLAQTGKTGVVHADAKEKGSVVFFMDFATIAPDGKTIKDRRVRRDLNAEEASLLAKEINSKVTSTYATFEFKNTIGHGSVLVARAMHHALSAQVIGTDPVEKSDPVVNIARPMPGYEKSPSAIEAAALLNEFTARSRKVLEEAPVNKKRIREGKAPANVVLSRDAIDSLPEILLVSGHPMDIVDVRPDSKHPNAGYATGADIVLQKMDQFDGLYISIKSPDEFGRDNDLPGKKAAAEAIDKHFFGNLLPRLQMRDVVFVVTAGHAASCSTEAPTALPAPLLVCGGRIRPDGSMSFSEKACSEGSLGAISEKDLPELLFKFARE